MPNPPAKLHIDALTSTRAFAAIMVFLFHFGRDTVFYEKFAALFNSGHIAVSYFFVLSGFVLYVTYAHRRVAYFNFLKKRVARIAPVYWLALGLFVVVYFGCYLMPYNAIFTRHLLYSFFFIQAYVPLDALCLNTAAWSISVEMLFYLLFPLLLLLIRKSKWTFVVLTVASFIITQIVYHTFCTRHSDDILNWNRYHYHPFMHVSQFMVGILAGMIFLKVRPANGRWLLVPTVLLAAVIALIVFQPHGVYYEAGMLAPVFGMLIIAIAVNNDRLLRFRPLVFLGEISYGIYILQFPVLELLHWASNRYLKLNEVQLCYFGLAVLVLTATASWHLLERPLRNLVNSAGTRKKANSLTAVGNAAATGEVTNTGS